MKQAEVKVGLVCFTRIHGTLGRTRVKVVRMQPGPDFSSGFETWIVFRCDKEGNILNPGKARDLTRTARELHVKERG